MESRKSAHAKGPRIASQGGRVIWRRESHRWALIRLDLPYGGVEKCEEASKVSTRQVTRLELCTRQMNIRGEAHSTT